MLDLHKSYRENYSNTIKLFSMISQQQTQKQLLKILPQQIQLLNLYFLNAQELEQRIIAELDENPILEVNEKTDDDENADKNTEGESVQDFQDWDEYGYDDIPDYKQEYQNYLSTEDVPEKPLVNVDHFKEDLKQQLRLLHLSDEEYITAEYLIDMLNTHGMLDKPMDEIADDLSFQVQSLIDVETLEKSLEIVQSLEPVGVGARSIRECLYLQLKQMNTKRPDVKCAMKLVGQFYEDLMHRQFEKLMHHLGVDEEELRVVLNFMGTLKFYPVTEPADAFEPKNTIIPDFIISKNGEDIHVALYSSRSNAVFVNQTLYDQLAEQCSKGDKSASQYIKSKLQSAQWFVSAVRQREETMMRIMQYITHHQKEYFEEGDIRLLKPMVLRHIAEQTGLDISTISRITSNKYAETHFGLVYLKNLFSEGIADKNGEVISNKVIQSVIEEAITCEDKKHPYTDQQLVHILSSKGYNIARRTVAKYREQLRIPIAQIRAVRA
ncbi:RNA polymerase factor sigma-54 [Taibaiella soli]|nr:RNA polymerase factor sigma-54 [Taibaiella soli]